MLGEMEKAVRLADLAFKIGEESHHPNAVWVGRFAQEVVAIRAGDKARLDKVIDLDPPVFASGGRELRDNINERIWRSVIFGPRTEAVKHLKKLAIDVQANDNINFKIFAQNVLVMASRSGLADQYLSAAVDLHDSVPKMQETKQSCTNS